MKQIVITLLICMFVYTNTFAVSLIDSGVESGGDAGYIYWACDSTTIDTPNTTDGSTVTAVDTNFVTGVSGNGIDFLISTSVAYFTVTANNSIDPDLGTIIFWFEHTGDAPPSFARLFLWGTDLGDFCLRRNNSTVSVNFEINDQNGILDEIPNLWDGTGRWVKVTWSTSANEKKIYTAPDDSGSPGSWTLEATATDTITTPTPVGSNFYVGNEDDGSEQIEGIIDEFYIYKSLE